MNPKDEGSASPSETARPVPPATTAEKEKVLSFEEFKSLYTAGVHPTADGSKATLTLRPRHGKADSRNTSTEGNHGDPPTGTRLEETTVHAPTAEPRTAAETENDNNEDNNNNNNNDPAQVALNQNNNNDDGDDDNNNNRGNRFFRVFRRDNVQQPFAAGQRIAGFIQLELPVWAILLLVYLVATGALNWRMFFLLIVISLSVTHLRRLVNSIHARRENWSDQPTYIGSLFTSPPTPVGRIGYIVLKSIEALIVSLYPNYSVLQLEMELQRDRIVR